MRNGRWLERGEDQGLMVRDGRQDHNKAELSRATMAQVHALVYAISQRKPKRRATSLDVRSQRFRRP